MTEQNDNVTQNTLIAIDIAKRPHDALIQWSSGKTKTVKILNSLAGYRQLLDFAQTAPDKISVAFEPTADYHRNIAYWLQNQGAACFLVSSLACARAREMQYQVTCLANTAGGIRPSDRCALTLYGPTSLPLGRLDKFALD